MSTSNGAAGGEARNPNEFVSAVAELLQARTKERSAAGLRRAKQALIEKQGRNMKALRLTLQLRDMDPDDANAVLAETFWMLQALNLEIGQQAKLFGAEIDQRPNDAAIGAMTQAVAFEEGYKAGRGGRDARDNRFVQGSPLHQKFYEGWIDGQAAIAAEMGVDRPNDGSALQPPKRGRKPAAASSAGAGVENRDAQPSGGARRGRNPKAKDAGTDSESGGDDPLEKARRHLN